MTDAKDLFLNAGSHKGCGRTYILELENGQLVFRRDELDLAIDAAIEDVFGTDPHRGDEIVPQKLAEFFPGGAR
jgi:hypothetical protein